MSSGKEEKLFEKLSDDAKEKIVQAISAFTAMNQQLVQGHIKISLLRIILQRRDAFLELQKIGNISISKDSCSLAGNAFIKDNFHVFGPYYVWTDCLSEGGQYSYTAKMKKLLDHRRTEVEAVYHEKQLVDVILDMSHKLEEHVPGMINATVRV